MIFLRTRLAMFAWGFAVTLYFTGNIDISSKIFIVQAIGNTLIMWLLMRNHYE